MKKYSGFALLLFAALCLAQEPSAQSQQETEQRELQAALAESGNSPREIARALEKHLEKFPESERRDELERTIVKAAMESDDEQRIVQYGERVLAKNPDQPLILERVALILLESENKAEAERALRYSLKFEEILRALEREGPSATRNRARLLEELDRALGRALRMQAQAHGILGNSEQAIELANRSWEAFPAAAAARESARWLAAAGRDMEAVEKYADAFTAEDPKNESEDRLEDRRKMAELYRKAKGAEAGLGDLVLAAYDRNTAIAAKRAALQRERDPNAALSDPMHFTLRALEGEPLKMETLLGKVVVLDFWATWCGPCRVQQPLYEEVKEKFAGRDDVVFLNINTDEDRSVVKPFLDENKWNKRVYFEDGLGQLLRVSSIPTTIVIDKDGRIFSRMNGFIPEKFVEQLTDRIREALGSTRAAVKGAG